MSLIGQCILVWNPSAGVSYFIYDVVVAFGMIDEAVLICISAKDQRGLDTCEIESLIRVLKIFRFHPRGRCVC